MLEFKELSSSGDLSSFNVVPSIPSDRFIYIYIYTHTYRANYEFLPIERFSFIASRVTDINFHSFKYPLGRGTMTDRNEKYIVMVQGRGIKRDNSRVSYRGTPF